MTIDKAQLKALAEAARNEIAENVARAKDLQWPPADTARFALRSYLGPDEILALLVEIEQLEFKQSEASMLVGDFAKYAHACQQERDQLKAELAGLRTGFDAQNEVIAGLKENKQGLIDLRETHGYESWAAVLVEVDRLNAENEALLAKHAECAEFIDQASLEAGDQEALRKDAERYRWLRDKKPNALHLERNTGNSTNYCTVAEWIKENPEWFDGTPAEDLAKMAREDSHWQIQIYPDTPGGFYVYSRATLDEVIDATMAGEKG